MGTENDKIKVRIFIINVSVLKNRHHLVEFDVPVEQFENCDPDDYDEIMNRAGWFYMNRIDLESCTGDYRFSIFPKEMLDSIKVK